LWVVILICCNSNPVSKYLIVLKIHLWMVILILLQQQFGE
jgi:hypothetical protein